MKKTLLSSLVIAVLLSGCGGGGDSGGNTTSNSSETSSSLKIVDNGTFLVSDHVYLMLTKQPSGICGALACYTLKNCAFQNGRNKFYLYSDGTMAFTAVDSTAVTNVCELDKAYKQISVIENQSYSDALWSTKVSFYSASLKNIIYHGTYVSDTESKLTLVYNSGRNAKIEAYGTPADIPLLGIYKELDLQTIGITIPQQP